MSAENLANEILFHIKASGYTASRLFKEAGIERFRGYDIINGVRIAERDEILRLVIVLGVAPDDVQMILENSGYPPLDSGDGRESAILFALKQGGDIDGLNDALKDMGYDVIS